MRAMQRFFRRHRAAFIVHGWALAALAAAWGAGALSPLAAAGALLAFDALCGIAAIVLAARRRSTASPAPPSPALDFCMGCFLAGALLLGIGAALAVAATFATGMVRWLFGSL